MGGMFGWKRVGTIVVIATAVATLGGGLAWSDEAVVDGDGITPVSASSLAFGSVCANTTVTKDVLFALSRSTSGAPNIFKNSSTATVTVGTVTGTGLGAVVPAPPASANTITLPATWQSQSTGTVSPAIASRVTFATGSPRSFAGSVAYSVTGTASNNTTIDRSTTLSVTATVATCDTTPPTLELPADTTVEATGPAGAVVTYTANANDTNPSHPTVACTPVSGSSFAIQTTTVNCSAADAAGNTGSGSFAVTVRDTTAPLISGMPSDVTAEATGASGATVAYTSPVATDVVDGARPVACLPTSGSVLPLGPNTITCGASDTRGNHASSAFVVTVLDTTGPLLTLPGSLVEEATGPSGATVAFAPSATDSVDGPLPVACDPASGATFPVGETVVGCSAADAHDNATDGSFTVTVQDTTAPALTVPPAISAEATGAGGAEVSYGVSAHDLVDGDLVPSCDVASGAMVPLGVTTVTCSVTDAHGNYAVASFDVTVTDTTAPTLHLPADAIVEADGPSGHVVTFATAAEDLVDGAMSPSCDHASGAGFPVGVTTVSCSVTDAHGNEATGSFTVTVTDTTAPILTLPDPITAEATSDDGASVDFTAVADDIVDGTVAVDCDHLSGSTFALGTTTVSCTATDAAGNTGHDAFTVDVVDTTPPMIEGTPGDLEIEATSSSGAEVTYLAPAASDIVDGDVQVTCEPASGSTFPLDQTTVVTCSATDAHGNAASQAFSVLVSDSTAPTLSLPDDLVAEATGPAGAVVSFAPSATDVVDGDIPVTCDPASGSTFGLGHSTVACSAVDAHDNRADGAFGVTVQDTTPPALALPDPITAEATGPSGAAVSYAASASDIVDGALSPACDVPSGSTFALGSTTVTCSATDAAGNTASGSFTVTVVDTTAPDLTLPTDITAEATGPSGAPVSYNASASDIVDGDVTPTCSMLSGATFGLGTTEVTCSATDAAGNTVAGSFDVTVRDTTAPTLSLPADITAEATGPSGATVPYAVSAWDIVDGSLAPVCVPASGATFPLGATTVGCSITDAAGNAATGGFLVVVQDTTAPELADTPSDVVQEASSASGAVVTFSLPTAVDLVDGTVAASCAPPSGSTFALDMTTTVTCTAADAAGNVATSSFGITVRDTTGPALTLPADITAEATGPAGASIAFAPSASDSVDGAVAVSCDPASGSVFGFGATTVSCAAADAHGNATSSSFTATVVDTTAPDLSLPASITVEATGAAGAVVSYLVSAHDVVDGGLAPVCAPSSGAMFAIGVTTVSCTVSDSHGNTGTGSFTVTVQDTTAPTLHLPAPPTATAVGLAGAPVAYTVTATDVVDGSVAASCLPSSGSTFAPGVTTVGCSAADAHGNSRYGTFAVTVSFDLTGGLLPPVRPGVLNVVKNGSTVPLKWQVRTPSGGYISSLAIVRSFVLTQVSCAVLTDVIDNVDFTTTGATALRYDDNQYIQNWQTPKKASVCYRVDVNFIGGLQRLSANFQTK